MSLNELLKIETTTSYRPDSNEFDAQEQAIKLEPIYQCDVIDIADKNSLSPYPETSCLNIGRPTSATIKFKERKCFNMTCRILYITLKIIYMSYWFYWGGYIVPIASYMYPYSENKQNTAKKPFYDEYRMGDKRGGKKSAIDERGFTYEDFIT